jgi:hypothetical protein
MTIPANSPTLRSWIPVAKDSDFPIQNIPFGIASWNGEPHLSRYAYRRYGDRPEHPCRHGPCWMAWDIPREAFLAPNLNA